MEDKSKTKQALIQELASLERESQSWNNWNQGADWENKLCFLLP
jgi:hypothetical protein